MLRQMRRSGLKMMLLGFPLMAFGIVFFVLLRDWTFSTFGHVVLDRVYIPKSVAFLLGAPMTVGYVLSVIGSFRALFGERGQTRSALASLGRIVYGLVVTFGFIIGAIVISAAVSRQSAEGVRDPSLGSGVEER